MSTTSVSTPVWRGCGAGPAHGPIPVDVLVSLPELLGSEVPSFLVLGKWRLAFSLTERQVPELHASELLEEPLKGLS